MTRLLCALTLLALAACATPTRTAQPTGSSESTTTLFIPTSTTTPGVVPTGSGPSAFTTTSAPGPVQVIVEAVDCPPGGYAGDGWRVRWRLENHATTRIHGPLAARIDDSDPALLAPDLALPANGRLVGTSTVNGSGESVTVAWAPAGRVAVSSFPVEVTDCPVDPADERAAKQATTSTAGRP